MHANLLWQQEEPNAVTCRQDRANMMAQKGVGNAISVWGTRAGVAFATEPCYVEASMISAGSPTSQSSLPFYVIRHSHLGSMCTTHQPETLLATWYVTLICDLLEGEDTFSFSWSILTGHLPHSGHVGEELEEGVYKKNVSQFIDCGNHT